MPPILARASVAIFLLLALIAHVHALNALAEVAR